MRRRPTGQAIFLPALLTILLLLLLVSIRPISAQVPPAQAPDDIICAPWHWNVIPGDSNARIAYTVPKDAGGMHYVVVESRTGKLDGSGIYSITVEDGAV